MNDELIRFVREALIQRLPKSEIRAKLLAARWPEDEVDNALDAFADIEFPIPIPRRRRYLSAREAFFYLAIFATLYVSAVSLGSLLYQLINRAFPDPVTGATGFVALATIRWSISALIIAFPLYVLLSRTMFLAIRQDPEKRTSKIRKWLTYLTLFVAGSVLLGDLITLVFNLLGGELTTRFVLKVGAVGGIAASIFGYYLWDLRQTDIEPDRWVPKHPGLRVFATGVVAAVAAGIVGGLFLVGSPGSARMTRLDDQRELDLQMISRAVDLYWSQHAELPRDLERLSRSRNARLRSIRDPQTRVPYEYRITGTKTYELCAVFEGEDERAGKRYAGAPAITGQRYWAHGAGRVCFPAEVESLPRVVVEPEPTPVEPPAESIQND
jgi:hypothetical protein